MTERTTPASELHFRLLEHYAPPSLLVDGNLDVIHVSENAGHYLRVAGGEPTRQLLQLAHPGLESELRAAIEAARRSGTATRSVRFEDRGRERGVDVRVRSIDVPELHGGLLVMFSDQDSQRDPSSGSTIEPVVRGMEDELHRTRDQLRATVDQYEASLEELGASNRELQTIGEELHDATIELETSKRQLQSVNEELTGRNQALKETSAEVTRAEERLRIALVSAPIVVLALDGSSATWGFVLGRELAPGDRDLSMFAPGRAARLLAAARDVIAKRAGTRMELDLVLDDGAIHTFDFRLEPGLGGATAVGFDITPSKQAEASLREADRRKDEFLATLSHELRNPLTPLQVALDVARLADDDPAQREQSLSIMERQVAMLTTLVDELLDLSRVTQGKIVLERSTVNVAHVLESALLATRPLFDSARHEIKIELPDHTIEIDGDRSRLVQVFTNLLSNAAKYTLPNGHISVRIRPQTQSVRVDISDDGLGISPDMLPTIFDIFVQCRDARGRSQGGLGIGLNLVRRLVELHGGLVTASSEGQGRGSTFVVELPLAGRG